MTEIIFYGAEWCSDCKRAKQFLNDNNISYEFVDVEIDKNATSLVETINNGKRIIPTILIDNKSFTNPDNNELASVLGINKVGNVILYGADWCPDCRRAKHYLQNNKINFQFIEVDKHIWAAEKVEQINNGKRIIPTILINNKPYTNPDNSILKEALQIDDNKTKEIFDSIIIGAGPAGLTASIYAQRDRFDTLILEKKNIGGNAALTEKIENYPGFTTISGSGLMKKMAEQAQTYGAKVETGVDVNYIDKKDDLFTIKTNMGEYYSKTVVISVGSTYRLLNIPNEKELIGAGVHFCATCDGAFYRDKEIIVIGGGNSALEESIFLAGFCKKVTIIHRKNEFSASETYIEKLKEIENITVLKNKESLEFLKNDKDLFKGILIKDNDSLKVEEVHADGTFIFIGLIPNTASFKNVIDIDESGFIVTNGLGQTNVPGVFAAGDCRKGAIVQVASATGEGVLASYGIRDFLK
jgi:thioredoxin reductase (NADPH)